jgi:hypothetical protein
MKPMGSVLKFPVRAKRRASPRRGGGISLPSTGVVVYLEPARHER